MTHIIHRNPRVALPIADSARGCYITDTSGYRYYDASGGAAVSSVGHAHPAILDAMMRQAKELEYAHTSFFTSHVAESLADCLSTFTPPGLDKVYFLSSGSEAVETAVKMARQYHVDNAEPSRTRFIARRQSYHGNTLGALSIGGNLSRRTIFEPLLMDVLHVSPCFSYRYQKKNESDEAYADRLADELEQTIINAGPETIAAFFAETIGGATSGAIEPVCGYLKKIRAICDRYGVLLVLDEIMCGMGRTGTLHAFEQEDVTPDILCLAKGLGGGYQPIGAVIAQNFIIDTIYQASGAFQHGHTYVGHPIACAAALAVQQLVQSERLIERCATLGNALKSMLIDRFGEHPHVGDIRGRGLFQAIELVAQRDNAAPFSPSLKVNQRIKKAAFSRGLLCYPGGGTIDGLSGDHVLLAPPFITTENELSQAVDILGQSLDHILINLHD